MFRTTLSSWRVNRAVPFAVVAAVSLWPALPADVVSAAAPAPRFVESELWMKPTEGDAPGLGAGALQLANGQTKDALATFQGATSDAVLGGYARLYQGRAELALDRARDAEASARYVIETSPGGYLGEAALWLLADAAEKQQDWTEAVRALQGLTGLRPANPAQAYLRLGRAALKLNDLAQAREAFAKAYYDYPLSAEASDAEAALKPLQSRASADLMSRELTRADLLYTGRRYDDARKAYVALASRGSAGDPALVTFRIAASDFYLKRYQAARDALRPIAERGGPRADEAAFLVVSALRLMKRDAEYLPAVRRFVDEHPVSSFAEQALNELATYYILQNDDADAAAVFTEMVKRFPKGPNAERAVWKAGWWAYKGAKYEETLRLFEIGLANFPRSDYRPSWLYWSARSHGRLGRPDAALAGFQQTMTSYRNSYYGREAARVMSELAPSTTAVAARTPVAAPTSARPRPSAFPSAGPVASARRDVDGTATGQQALVVVPGRAPARLPLIRALLIAGLNDDAIAELRKAQRDEGTSPYIEATIAYALNRKGDLRGAITAMRRAYPQFMADGGEQLPVSILKVIFPLDFWDLIHREARAANLDPYLTVALVAQESTFQPAVRSAANAWGLMQIIPATGRRYAPFLGLGRFSTSLLTDPAVNVRIGMTYFSELMKQFGDPAFALAAYNAGENRVARWRAERPGVPRDEFIDDIPFPETQNYVKRIIGTAEDYRILYGANAESAAVR